VLNRQIGSGTVPFILVALLTKIDRKTPRIQVGAFMKFHFDKFDKFQPNGPCQTALALKKKSHYKVYALPNCSNAL